MEQEISVALRFRRLVLSEKVPHLSFQNALRSITYDRLPHQRKAVVWIWTYKEHVLFVVYCWLCSELVIGSKGAKWVDGHLGRFECT